VAAGLALLLILIVAVATLMPPLPPIGGGPGPSNAASGSASPSGPSVSPSPTFVRPTLSPSPTFRTYVVVRGDTLTSIARQFRTTPRSIAFWNRATYPSLDPLSEDYDPNRIDIGWTLALIPGSTIDEDDLPSPSPDSPSPTAPPTPSITPIPTGPSRVVSHGRRGTDMIALTFDMGGRLEPAVAIMDWLIDNEVRATIFPTGASGTETAIGRQVLERVRDHPELFELANHSWDHPSFVELTAVQMADQLERTEAALYAKVGRTTRPWFRPPFGAWNETVRRGVGAAGWAYTVLWDIDTIDWRPPSDGGPTAPDIEAKVLSRAEGGSIVLMHLGGWHTLEALPGIAAGLRDKGLRPVTLTEMFGP
jgi:peptidoglycan/xylan/chitin deacetylase (PgdA/CDA1 family)